VKGRARACMAALETQTKHACAQWHVRKTTADGASGGLCLFRGPVSKAQYRLVVVTSKRGDNNSHSNPLGKQARIVLYPQLSIMFMTTFKMCLQHCA
jgi:hypothetical protein